MYLIDSHVLLWLLENSPQLSTTAKDIIQNQDLAISIASLWEIEIKRSIGKLQVPFIPTQLAKICTDRDIQIVPVTPAELDVLGNLPFIHRDPFDRIIISTAFSKGYPLLTHDENIQKYNLQTIW